MAISPPGDRDTLDVVRRSFGLLLVAAATSATVVTEARAEETVLTPANVSQAANSDQVAPPDPNAELLAPVPDEAPPPPPRHHGFVLESSLGAVGFMGQFRHVSPPAFWMHAQFGYEPLSWLMFFADGEIFYSDTSEAQDLGQVSAFPVFGFGGGIRFTIHATERFAVFAQGGVGATKADVPKDTLVLLGYPNAETLSLSLSGRLGLEWYQMDRHLALGLMGGIRDAQGFAKLALTSDTPLMWDGAATIRYTF